MNKRTLHSQTEGEISFLSVNMTLDKNDLIAGIPYVTEKKLFPPNQVEQNNINNIIGAYLVFTNVFLFLEISQNLSTNTLQY